jgi:hypothetical protein
MKNAGTALRKAYYQKLNGQITVRGEAVPVLAGDELVSSKPYIMLTGQTGSDISGKDGWSDDRTILVDIITSSAEGISGPSESEDIATQICELIAPSDFSSWPDVGPNFKITTLQKISENDLVEGSATETVYRKLLRFRHQIHEL